MALCFTGQLRPCCISTSAPTVSPASLPVNGAWVTSSSGVAAVASGVAGLAALSALGGQRREGASRVTRASVGRRDAGAAAAATAIIAVAGPASEAQAKDVKYPLLGDEDIMKQKAHGTSPFPVQEKLRWNCDNKEADRVCSYNREYAEYAGYWRTTSFLPELRKRLENKDATGDDMVTTFYDSVTGKELFTAPKGRSVRAFLEETFVHGWPSFRDEEVNWENVRCLRKSGECVSVDGTHLGHNIPDGNGNRYCINLVSVAGFPAGPSAA